MPLGNPPGDGGGGVLDLYLGGGEGGAARTMKP